MQDLGKKVRWPWKGEKSCGWKDKSKWCTYHGDFSHITEDCVSLTKEISYLLRKGHLKEIIGRLLSTKLSMYDFINGLTFVDPLVCGKLAL